MRKPILAPYWSTWNYSIRIVSDQRSKPISHAAQLLLHFANNAVKTQILISARNAAAFAKGMVGLRSIVFYSREERGRWRQGPRCLRCLELRMVGGLGGLMTTPRRSSGCGACIPELTIRRHRGPLLCLGSRAKASTLQGRHRRFTGGSAFHMSFRGLLLLLAT